MLIEDQKNLSQAGEVYEKQDKLIITEIAICKQNLYMKDIEKKCSEIGIQYKVSKA